MTKSKAPAPGSNKEGEDMDSSSAESSKGILKFLPPSETEWRELRPTIDEVSDDVEDQKSRASESRELLRESLLTALQMPHLVVLSGSGTSLGEDIGGPSMWDLWDHAMHENAPTDNGEKPVLSEISRNVISKTGYDQSTLGENIEAFLSRCEAYLEVHTDQGVQDFVKECKRVTLEQCTNFLRDKDSGEWRDEKLDGHGAFLHRLSRRRVRDPRLKIFTTNYDLCFERASALKNLIAIDGFSFAQPRRFDPSYFEYDVVRRPLLSPEVGDPLEGVFHLLKLHGSVNWERDENGGIRETLCPSPERACLIYPATGKYQQSYVQPHLELMAQYLAALRQPNTCLMVAGFGFNDDHLAEPILAAAGSNPQLRVIVVDYQAEDFVANRVPNTSRHWSRLADLARSGENIWFINAAFSDFANLLPDLKALTPAQQLEKSIKRMGRYS